MMQVYFIGLASTLRLATKSFLISEIGTPSAVELKRSYQMRQFRIELVAEVGHSMNQLFQTS